MEYYFHIIVLIGIYTILSVSLDLLVGRTGLLSVTHAAFYGLGAYTSALLALRVGMPFPLSVSFGMATVIVMSLLVSSISLRLHDDYFVIATLAFQMLFIAIFNNFYGLTNGSQGISNIPMPSIFGLSIQTPMGFVFLSTFLAIIASMIVARIAGSPFGRILLAIREDEIFAAALGKDATKAKVIVIAASGALAALAGGLYAHYSTYISPQNFTVSESIFIISIIIIGGAGNIWGSILGAIMLVVIPEALRFLGMPNAIAANIRQIIYGSLLILCMMYRPQGLLGRYSFDK